MKRIISTAVLALPGLAFAAPNAATVPWVATNPNIPHDIISGQATRLKGGEIPAIVAGNKVYTAATYEWDFGDGTTSGVRPAPADKRLMAMDHTYNAPDGSLITARLTVCDAGGDCDSAIYRLAVRQRTLEVETNIAIDDGLWYLHVNARTNGQIIPSGGYNTRISATAAAVNAFEVHGHLPSGDRETNPYVDSVGGGLNWVLGTLQSRGLGNQAAGNPDSNGNGRYLSVASGQEVYENGMVMDAIVASGNPNAVATVGVANGDTYLNIVQDLIDGYAYGQMEHNAGDLARRGSWYYTYGVGNNSAGGHADNSASQWAAIGMIPAERQWGAIIPQWVKDQNLNAMDYTFQDGANGAECGTFGYSSRGYCPWGCAAVTPSGMVQLVMDGKGPGVPAFRGIQAFDKAARWVAEYWGNGPAPTDSNHVTGYTYGLFAAVKALRLAGVDFLTDNTGGCNGNGQDVQFDWYSDDTKGVARTLISLQNRTTGAFAPRNRSADVTGLASQWSLIMLASQLFEQGPVAQCESDPSIDGTLDLGGNAEFDGSGSFHLDPIGEIVSYSWTFGDGATANGQIVSHAYAAEGIYQARLTVTDANGLTDSALCPIDVRRNNIPPNAEIARPYTYCEGDTITLDGSASRDLGEDGGIVAYDWDYTLPLNFAAIDASGAQVDATALFAAPGVYDVGLRVTDTDGEHAFEFASFEVLSAADPRCNQPPVARCQDVTIDADAQCGACVDINAGSSDPDGDALTITAEPGCDFPLGSTQVTLTVSDGKLQDTCTATVTVVDASAPTATCQGDRVECGGPATAVNTACTGSDNCGAPTVTSTAQGTYGPGSHSFDCTATDAAGNSTTEFCTVEVIDSTAPTAACTGDVQECTGALTAVVTTCTAEDLCAGGEIAAQSDAEAAYALGNHSFTCGAVDAAGNSDAIECAVLIADTLAPSIECAAPVTVSAEADRCVGLVATPGATASDICEGDLATAANPDQGEWVLGTTAVTHTTADSSGNGASCETAVTVIDDTAPTAACNAFDIAPNQAPTAFTATATDNCSVESITVVAYDCWKINGAGKRMSKLESCEVAIDGDTITINDVGGVGTHIDWTVVTVDGSGNSTTTECGITGLHPNGNGDNVGCNQGVGNGEEGCDPGNSNQGNPDNTNDEPSSDGTGTPGNPGKKGGKK